MLPLLKGAVGWGNSMSKDFNQPKIIESYDQHIQKLIPGYALMHQQIQVLLYMHLKQNAHLLIIGCGTGYELIQLALAFPNVQFTAIDVAENMIKKAQQNIKHAQIKNKIDFLCGDTSILSTINYQFDAALSILVAHFVPMDLKKSFFTDIYHAIKPNACLIHVDLMAFEHENGAEYLVKLAQLTGLHPKQSQLMLNTFDKEFYLMSTQEMDDIYAMIGFKKHEYFLKIFNYYGAIVYK